MGARLVQIHYNQSLELKKAEKMKVSHKSKINMNIANNKSKVPSNIKICFNTVNLVSTDHLIKYGLSVEGLIYVVDKEHL